MPLAAPLFERFWRYVAKGDGCWLWVGSKNGPGYGKIGAGGKGGRTVMAHRISWEIANGPVPEGLHVCHHCDVPACVRPDHLFVGTRSDNMRDAESKGRVKHTGYRGRTHCKRGHPFAGENLYVMPNGIHRRCRTCTRWYRLVKP